MEHVDQLVRLRIARADSKPRFIDGTEIVAWQDFVLSTPNRPIKLLSYPLNRASLAVLLAGERRGEHSIYRDKRGRFSYVAKDIAWFLTSKGVTPSLVADQIGASKCVVMRWYAEREAIIKERQTETELGIVWSRSNNLSRNIGV